MENGECGILLFLLLKVGGECARSRRARLGGLSPGAGRDAAAAACAEERGGRAGQDALPAVPLSVLRVRNHWAKGRSPGRGTSEMDLLTLSLYCSSTTPELIETRLSMRKCIYG